MNDDSPFAAAPFPPPVVATLAQPSAGKVYVVPQRFGLTAILAITTAMAMLFGLLRYCGAHPAVYTYLGLQALAICGAQMRFGGVPRMASLATGAVLLPLTLVGVFVWEGGLQDGGATLVFFTAGLPCSAVAGALVGYLTGTCAAGVFLLIDACEARWRKGRS